MVERVLVTGGAGFIGSHLVDGLVSGGFFARAWDVINACLRAMRCKNCVGETIDVGSGAEISINRLADVLIELFGTCDVKPVYGEPKAGDIRQSYADLSKTERLLGYKPEKSLRDGLSLLLR